MTSDSELRVRIAALVYRYNLSAHKFKLLCEWLDCYNYILPNDRSCLGINVYIADPANAFQLWQWLRIVTCSLTIDEQYASWQLINESSILAIAHS